jgi:hypothetical protein
MIKYSEQEATDHRIKSTGFRVGKNNQRVKPIATKPTAGTIR